MKMKLILGLVVSIFFMTKLSAQENSVKYEEINGVHYKYTYHKNEVLKAKEHVRKEADGSYTSLDFYEFYDKDGNIMFKGNKINGRHIEYYTSGQKKIYGAIINSEKQGRWAYYNKNGDILKVEVYDAGELVDTIVY